MPKKILIVSNAFYPENSPRSFRTTELAKEFARQGHRVTVITHRHPEQADIEREYGIAIRDLGPLKWKGFTVKGKGLVRLFWRFVSRMSGLFFEYPNIQLVNMVARALKQESGYDLLISIAVPYPVHWGVAKARTPEHQIAPIWVADCGDPYMGRENDTFQIPFYFAYVEKWFCQKADYLTVPTQGAIQGYYPEFHAKIRVIPQGFRFEDFQSTNTVKNPDKPTFAYAGMFIPGRRDPSELLQYLVQLDRDFEFYIYTRDTHLVEPFLEAGRGRILLCDYIPRSKLLHRLSKMDFVVNFENEGNKQRPSKIIDYTIVGKPVLSIQTGALDRCVVDEFLSKDYSHQMVIENPDQYRIENVAAQFLSLTAPVKRKNN